MPWRNELEGIPKLTSHHMLQGGRVSVAVHACSVTPPSQRRPSPPTVQRKWLGGLDAETAARSNLLPESKSRSACDLLKLRHGRVGKNLPWIRSDSGSLGRRATAGVASWSSIRPLARRPALAQPQRQHPSVFSPSNFDCSKCVALFVLVAPAQLQEVERVHST